MNKQRKGKCVSDLIFGETVKKGLLPTSVSVLLFRFAGCYHISLKKKKKKGVRRKNVMHTFPDAYIHTTKICIIGVSKAVYVLI